ncbi:MAG: hypothetical protein DRQ55_05720 [Planctomycetota bacterium]|nr:MAG: hypothetical protein DRQ55_05720 [Planctomycetota bacterium]
MLRHRLRPDSRSSSCSALAAALLLLAGSHAAAQVDSLSDVYPAGSLRGEAAVSRLGSELARVAAEHNLDTDALARTLRDDDSLWVSADGRLFHVDAASAQVEGPPPTYAGSIPGAEAFTLHSRPGASKIVYLDFTGHHSVNNSWGHDIQFPPYNTSGGNGTFTSAELGQIITWWERTAEDYAPFDVDVTTEEPPLSALTKIGGGDSTFGIRVVCTQITSGFGSGSGGIAFLYSFNDSTDNPCFAFNKGNNTGSMTVSHESGHSFGLSHDGLNGMTYHPGTGSGETSWGPIMGAPFNSSLVQWSTGDYAGASTGQNDANIITSNSNGVDFMPDDFGDDHTDATPMPPAPGCPAPEPARIEGLIERRTDVDSFSFSTGGGVVTIAAIPFSPGGNLDIQIEVLTSSGVPVATENQANEADALMSVDLAPGDYVILIDGVGKTGVYSDYGCLGQYRVELTQPGQQQVTNLGGGVVGSNNFKPGVQWNGLTCPGEGVGLILTTAPPNATAFLAFGLAELGVPFKGGVMVPDLAPPGDMLALQVSGFGHLGLATTWPSGFPSGTSVYFQFWIPDAQAATGVAASDGLRVTTQ